MADQNCQRVGVNTTIRSGARLMGGHTTMNNRSTDDTEMCRSMVSTDPSARAAMLRFDLARAIGLQATIHHDGGFWFVREWIEHEPE